MPDLLELPPRNDLSDLFVRGTELVLKDGDIEHKVWLQKLNPIERQKAARAANAAKARFMTARHDKTSDEYIEIQLYVDSLEKDEKIQPLLSRERGKVYRLKGSELEKKAPWKDGYIDGLRDAWNNGLDKVYDENPKEPEAKRVHDQIFKFRDAMIAAGEEELEGIEAALQEKSDEELSQDLIELLFKGLADNVSDSEFIRCEIWLGVRNIEDHSPIFPTREAVDVLQEDTITTLGAGFAKLDVNPEEGKG